MHGDQTRRGGNFYRVDHAPALVKTFGKTNADVRSVCSS